MFLPRVRGDGLLDFAPVAGPEELVEGAFGIREPAPEIAPAVLASLELVVIPALAFDATGVRLGRGGGYYDRTLAATGIPTLGAALSEQCVAALPCEPHDLRVDAVVTELGLQPSASRESR